MNKFFFGLFNSIYKHRNLLVQLIKRNIESRYKGHTLGMLWTIIQPLIMLSVYTFVFSVVFKARWGDSITSSQGAYAIIMFCGMTLFSLFSESVNSSCSLIIGNPNYVKKIIFPLELLPIAQTISTFIIGLGWITLLIIGVFLVVGSLQWTALLFPFLLVPLFLVTLGIAFFVASMTVYLRDVQYFTGVILQILFFVTPIFYPINAVPEKYRELLLLNPLTELVENARKVLIYGQSYELRSFIYSFFVSLVIFFLGYLWFRKTKKGFADVI